MAASDPATDVPTPTGTLQGVAVFNWDGTNWQPSGRAGPSVATPTGVLRGVAAFNGGPAWQPAGLAQPGVATPTGALDGVAVYTWTGDSWAPPGGTATPSTPHGALRGVAAFNWDGAAWQPAGQAGPSVATPYGVLDGVAMFNWSGSAWAAVGAPTLSLDFMTPGALDPRITFTHASTATYFNSAGVMQTAAANAPRWDYNPATLALQGLLIEEARTNINPISTSFTGWNPANSTITPGAGIAPDNTNSMSRFAETAATGIHYISGGLTTTGSVPYTFSLFAAAVQSRYLQMAFDDGTNGGFATFDLQAGVITGAFTAYGSGVLGIASIQPVGNGIYRCSVTVTAPGTAGRMFVALSNVPTPIFAPSYPGNAANGLLIWGAQLEQGAFPTSYIPTSAAAVTRSADLVSMPTAAWFSAASGTYQAEFIPNGVAAGLPIVISGNAGSPTIATGADSRLVASIRSGAAVFSATGPAYTFGAVNKAAFAYLSGASTAAVNGTAFGPSAAALTVTGTVVEFGSDGVTLGNNALDGWLRRVRYWPRILSNAELQQVTT